MDSLLDFRDSIFPYIGLIVAIFIFVVTLIPAICMHHKKVLFWSLGNLIGYFVGWLLLFLVGSLISTAVLKLVIPSDIDVKATTLAPMLNQIIPIIWFPIFLLIWNLLILLPNYFIWYKRAVGLKKLKTVKTVKEIKGYKHNQIQIKIKIGMLFLSMIAYAPITISVGVLIESATVSQSHVNQTSKGMAKTFDALSTITYVNQTRINLDALQAVSKLYLANVNTSDGKQQHPYEFIRDAFDKFFLFPSTDISTFKEYISDNFQEDTTNDDRNFYVRWLDADCFGNKFYQERNISSFASQLMLPKALTTAAPEILANYLNIDAITYEEITNPVISLDYTDKDSPKISLREFMESLLDSSSGVTIKVPKESEPLQSEEYHLFLFKEGEPDFRIKVLAQMYQNLCTKIAEKVIENGSDDEDFDDMVALTKDCLAKIFFVDHTPDGTPYTATSQISNTF